MLSGPWPRHLPLAHTHTRSLTPTRAHTSSPVIERIRAREPLKKPAKKAAEKAPAKPRKTAAQRRAEEMAWYEANTSFYAFFKEQYDNEYEEVREHAEYKGYRLHGGVDDYIDEEGISKSCKVLALNEWLNSKTVEEMQASIDRTDVPMPAAIKKRAKAQIKLLQEARTQRPRRVMRRDERELRRAELEESLRQRHPDLRIRDDSKMCDSYLKLRHRDDARLRTVTDIMHEMWFLFNHTNYNAIQNLRCSQAQNKRDLYRDMLPRDVRRDFEEFGYPHDEDWIDYHEIREEAKAVAVREYVRRVGRNNLPDFFPPTMRSWR